MNEIATSLRLRIRPMRWMACLALICTLLAVTWLFWQGLSGPFMFDDRYNIPQTKVSSLNWSELANVVLGNRSGPLRRPVSTLTFTFNHYLAGSLPFGFKYVNLMLHLLNALLLFWLGGLLLRWLMKAQLSDKFENDSLAWVIAGVAALLWAVHPIQVGTVLYAVQRMAMLAGMFNLAALLCYTVIRQRLVTGQGGVVVSAVMIGVFSLLGLLSKESGALIVFYILALELSVFRFACHDRAARDKLIALLTIFCAIPIAAGTVYFLTHTDTLLGEYVIRDFDLWDRLITQPGVLWFYVQMILLPDISQMSVFHDDYPVATLNWLTGLQIVSVIGAPVVAIALSKRAPMIALAILWFLVSHAIESTVFPLELVFEHRNYLAAWSILLAVSYYLVPSRWQKRNQQLRIACLSVIAVVLAFQTHTRAETWSDFGVLAAVTVTEHPDSARARQTMAQLLVRQRQFEAALEHLHHAERLNPHNGGHTLSVLLTECLMHRVSQDTIERARQKLAAFPISTHSASVINFVISVTMSRICPGLDERALLHITSGLAEYAAREMNNMRRSAAFAYFGMAQSLIPEQRDAAIDSFMRSVQADPSNIVLRFKMAELQALAGRIDEAWQTVDHAKRQNARNLIDQSHLFEDMEKRLERIESKQSTATERSSSG